MGDELLKHAMTRKRLYRAALLSLMTAAVALVYATPAGSSPDQVQLETWDVTAPRGKTRLIDFTTTEGTGMSVDISPDGKWLTFDLLSHVYRVPIAGGEARSLTQDSGIALNYHPKFSPDGKRIAFVSDRHGQNNLWVMDADGGNPRPIFIDLDTPLAEPAWTPDGKAVVAVRFYPHSLGPWSRTSRLWMFPLDGRAPYELATSTNTLVSSPSVAPDGRHVYYHSSSMPVTAEGYFKIGTHHQLRRLELSRAVDEVVSEAATRRYYHREPFYAFAPSVSPDGRSLAFARRVPGGSTQHRGVTYAQRTGLWVRDLDTGRERLAIGSMSPDQLETHTMYQIRLLPGFAWARDGASIVYAEGGQLRRSYLEDGRVETIPFRARVKRRISEPVRPSFRVADASFPVKFPRWPALSPDGKTVAFEAIGALWLQSLPNGKPRRLIDPSEAAEGAVELTPAWSPDGEWLAYATWSDEEGGHLWKVKVAGGSSQRLTADAGEYLNPAWSPDGRELVAARGSGAGLRGEGTADHPWNDLVRIPAQGGAPLRLIRVAPAGDEFVRPSYLADGRIYYVGSATPEERAGAPRAYTALRSVNADGHDVRTHATTSDASDVQPSPDGKWLAITAVESVFLVPFSGASGKSVPFIDRRAANSGVARLNASGGFFPRWTSNGKLGFVSGPRLFVLDPSRGGSPQQFAIDLQIERPIPQGVIALTNARILTMHDRKVIECGTILVHGNRIVGLGQVDVSKADEIIDLEGRTVMPGLIDVHAHHHRGTPDGEVVPLHRVESANYLAYGVTTAFDPAAPSQMIFPAAELTAAGRMIGPRLYSTGQVIVGSEDALALHSYAEARQTAERLVSSGAMGLKQYYQPRRTQRQWVSEAARERGDVLVTGEGMDFAYNLSMIMDGQTAWEHPILDIPLYADVVQFVARSGVVYNPALITPGQGLYLFEYFMARGNQTEDPKQQRWVRWDQLMRKKNHTLRPLAEYPAVFSVEGVKDIVRAGGKVGVGGHGQEQGLGTHWEIWTFAMALDPIEALEAATINNARYLGIDRDVGSLEVGKMADLVILGADPLAKIENSLTIDRVMIEGRLFDADTLDEVWPRSKAYGARRWTMDSAIPGRSE